MSKSTYKQTLNNWTYFRKSKFVDYTNIKIPLTKAKRKALFLKQDATDSHYHNAASMYDAEFDITSKDPTTIINLAKQDANLSPQDLIDLEEFLKIIL